MSVQVLYAIALLFGVAMAAHQRCPLLIRSAAVLAVNFIACNLAVVATGDYAPSLWFILIDTASAFVLLWQPTGRTPAILALVYFLQLGLHFPHWFAAGHGDTVGYLTMLTVGGGLQIAFLIMGAINGDGRKVGSRRGGRGGNGMDLAHSLARSEKERG